MQNIEHTPWWPQLILTWKLACKQISQSWEQHIWLNNFNVPTAVPANNSSISCMTSLLKKEGVFCFFSNRCTHKNTVLCFLSFFFFFFSLLWILEKLVSNKWKEFASCLLIIVSMSKCSWEICHIYLTVMAIPWPPKTCCCKA